MSRDRNQEKTETDANDVIREYVESSGTDDEGNQTNMEWYEQAKQDTTVPPDAVLAGGDIDAAWDKAAVGRRPWAGRPRHRIRISSMKSAGRWALSMRARNRCIRPRNLNGATNSGGNSTLLLLKTSPSVIKIMTNRRFHRRPLLVQSALLLPLSGGNATPPDCVQALQLVEINLHLETSCPGADSLP